MRLKAGLVEKITTSCNFSLSARLLLALSPLLYAEQLEEFFPSQTIVVAI